MIVKKQNYLCALNSKTKAHLMLLLQGEDETPDIEDLAADPLRQFYSNITSPHYQFIITYGHTGQAQPIPVLPDDLVQCLF